MKIKVDADLDRITTPDLIVLIGELDAYRDRAAQVLEDLRSRCEHYWGEVQEDREHVKGLTIEPKFAGSDYLPGVDIPPKTHVTWTRECIHCFLVQTTDKQKEISTPATSKFEPDFGG